MRFSVPRPGEADRLYESSSKAKDRMKDGTMHPALYLKKKNIKRASNRIKARFRIEASSLVQQNFSLLFGLKIFRNMESKSIFFLSALTDLIFCLRDGECRSSLPRRGYPPSRLGGGWMKRGSLVPAFWSFFYLHDSNGAQIGSDARKKAAG